MAYGAALPSPDRDIQRIRQWRHFGQPDRPSPRSPPQPPPAAMSGQPYTITAVGRGRQRLRDQLRGRHLDDHPGCSQSPPTVRPSVYGAAIPTLTASYSGFVNGDTSASLTTRRCSPRPPRPQPCFGQPVQHYRQRRGRQRLHDQLRVRHPQRHPGGTDDHRL